MNLIDLWSLAYVTKQTYTCFLWLYVSVFGAGSKQGWKFGHHRRRWMQILLLVSFLLLSFPLSFWKGCCIYFVCESPLQSACSGFWRKYDWIRTCRRFQTIDIVAPITNKVYYLPFQSHGSSSYMPQCANRKKPWNKNFIPFHILRNVILDQTKDSSAQVTYFSQLSTNVFRKVCKKHCLGFNFYFQKRFLPLQSMS